ncbi:hypothetical protein EBF04_26740 [Streptomyces sp. I6]|nr:hypothetical protein EBF04_26740 [Streptomyces sp. I6]
MTPQLKDDVTELSKRQDVPPELEETVDQLSSTLRMVEDPKTPLPDRHALAKSVGQLTVALRLIEDPKTSPKERQALLLVVRPLTTSLQIIGKTPPSQRAAYTACARQLTGALRLIEDPKTTAQHREALLLVVRPLNSSLKIITRTPPSQRAAYTESVQSLTLALRLIEDPKTSPEHRRELGEAVQPLTRTLQGIEDPKTPPERRRDLTESVRPQSDELADRTREILGSPSPG